MTLVKERDKILADLKSGERTVLQLAHDLVVNENYPDLPEALDFMTDQENEASLISKMIEDEDYEQCAELIRSKKEILENMEDDDDDDEE